MYGQEAVHANSNPPKIEVELLSDTKGVDLGPYIRAMLSDLKSHWLAAADGRRSVSEPQQAVISLTIAPNGQLSAMRLEQKTENTVFDKAAWSATKATHYSALPSGLKDSPLKLRVVFLAD
jgi:TonB family protein